MHQAIAWNIVTLWHTVQIPQTLLEAQVRSASICEEQWVGGERFRMKETCASCLNVKICVFLLPTQSLLLGGSWDNYVPQAPDRTFFEI